MSHINHRRGETPKLVRDRGYFKISAWWYSGTATRRAFKRRSSRAARAIERRLLHHVNENWDTVHFPSPRRVHDWWLYD